MNVIGAQQNFVTLERNAQNIPQRRRSGLVPELLGGSQLILSRRLCSFRSKTLDNVGLTKRALSALVLETLAHSSYPKTGIYITLVGEVANIWTWDISIVEKLTNIPARHAIPETLFHKPEQGFRLRACIEGYEGQFWRNNTLVSSRWWPDVPQSDDWSNFVRAGGGDLPEEVETHPETIDQGFQDDIKAPANRVPFSYKMQQLSYSVFLFMALAVLSTIAVFYGVRNSVLEFHTRQYSSELEVLNEATVEKRILRRQLIQHQKELGTYNLIFQSVEPLSAISAMTRAVANIGAEVTQIDFSDDQIDMRFKLETKFSQRDLVQALESDPDLKGVSVSRLGLTDVWVISAMSVNEADAND